MSRVVWMRRVIYMDESCHMCEWDLSHVWMQCVTYEWVLSHVWMQCVTRVHESCHTYEWVMSHMWMRHVANNWNMLHSFMSHVTHMEKSCHTCGCVMSHWWLGHCHTYSWIMAQTRKVSIGYAYDWFMSDLWLSHVTLMNESCHTDEWAMSKQNCDRIAVIAGIAFFWFFTEVVKYEWNLLWLVSVTWLLHCLWYDSLFYPTESVDWIAVIAGIALHLYSSPLPRHAVTFCLSVKFHF